MVTLGGLNEAEERRKKKKEVCRLLSKPLQVSRTSYIASRLCGMVTLGGLNEAE